MPPGAEPVPQNFVSFMCTSLGACYGILLPLAGLVCFLLSLVVVIRGKGPMAGAALILIVHVPLLIGVFAAIHGAISSCMIIATSVASPKPSVIADAASLVLVAPMVAMFLMAPSYMVAATGAFIRCLLANAEPVKPD